MTPPSFQHKAPHLECTRNREDGQTRTRLYCGPAELVSVSLHGGWAGWGCGSSVVESAVGSVRLGIPVLTSFSCMPGSGISRWPLGSWKTVFRRPHGWNVPIHAFGHDKHGAQADDKGWDLDRILADGTCNPVNTYRARQSSKDTWNDGHRNRTSDTLAHRHKQLALPQVHRQFRHQP